jgi:hypothetical protein
LDCDGGNYTKWGATRLWGVSEGLVITAAHLTAVDANMSVRIAGATIARRV